MDDETKKKIIKWLCIGLLVIVGISSLVFLAQALKVIIVPVIGIVIVIWLLFGDTLAENWQYNKQQQELEAQRVAVENEQRYYEIMREIIVRVLKEMLNVDVYEDVLRYDGPYVYGPGAYGPIYYYDLPFDYFSNMTSLQKKELKQRFKRTLSKKYNIPWHDVENCVAFAPGPGGIYLVLICFDTSAFSRLKKAK